MGAASSVLVADDDDALCESIADVLRDEGYDVRTARHGGEALELLRSEPPCLMLLDLMMPVVSGWEVLDALRHDEAVRARTRVVVISAAGKQALAQLPSWVEVMAKPLDYNALIHAVERHCAPAKLAVTS